jgi:hypothetical protein
MGRIKYVQNFITTRQGMDQFGDNGVAASLGYNLVLRNDSKNVNWIQLIHSMI